jgi:hypothetical protein
MSKNDLAISNQWNRCVSCCSSSIETERQHRVNINSFFSLSLSLCLSLARLTSFLPRQWSNIRKNHSMSKCDLFVDIVFGIVFIIIIWLVTSFHRSFMWRDEHKYTTCMSFRCLIGYARLFDAMSKRRTKKKKCVLDHRHNDFIAWAACAQCSKVFDVEKRWFHTWRVYLSEEKKSERKCCWKWMNRSFDNIFVRMTTKNTE